ncbi:MAG: LysM peptidoglycan-binding domain-containing protein [Lachnospiraceae bacterium]|nr:LysM peptidoglycan-binding domain-containing protein [Lachnospiraceae bacterium]
MKKFVRRAMAVAMAAAMMVLSMGNMSVAQAAEEAASLDIATRVFVNGSGPVDNADGSITFSGQNTMKSSFALPTTLAAGESIKVNVKMQFNSDADTAVRFYLIANASDVSTATEIQTIANEGTGSVVEKTFTLTAAADSTELLFASSGYGVNIDNVTIYDIFLGDKPAEAPAETPAASGVALDISKRVFNNGADPVNNADGSITFNGGATMKCSFALPEVLAAGDSITFKVALQFDSEADAGVRFYLINNANDASTATEIQSIANEGVGTKVEKTLTLTAAADSTELLFASSGYGVYIDNVTVYGITLEDAAAEEPKAEEPKADEPAVEEPKADEPVAEEPKTEEPAVEVTAGEYVVKAGDTLGKIAAAYGLTVKEFAEANSIENADLIKVGAKLAVPSVDTAKRHLVVAGDTLGKIAKAYGYTVADLVSANAIENADLIKVGQLIVFP